MGSNLKEYLDNKVEKYNRVEFIENDPIVIPHGFSVLQDIEISGFFAAILAWGLRKTIINKCNELMQRMDNSPYDFIRNSTEQDSRQLLGFKHRTFNDTDLLYTVDFLKRHYAEHNSLESAFTLGGTMKTNLEKFHHSFFNTPYAPQRTRKHIATPERKSACKRLNMYMRWMVRHDNKGVDFGLWKTIKPKDLICPLDVHVGRTARFLGLLERTQDDWKAAMQLTQKLRFFDKNDPVKYDFALFGLSIENDFS
ncbi:uncharacterized protein (TIGR02757 family) [Balneicella halophila]|uniref:Uncharacterized protein (TIGR02757 family) n=1 Tax=Balneicella halophila TaxID=1537566 RepID=A0A7L4USU8_BALHA|nr:TIGR02757 family protein [Balneicella halophila]PVX52541.1 uncharacterized protein (TIGR02757 family) [Balneicella halophila]